jgi:hypothetical protein
VPRAAAPRPPRPAPPPPPPRPADPPRRRRHAAAAQLVGAVCRPPRDDAYDDADLPGGARATFALAGGAPGAPRVKFYRQDSELRSPRGLLLRTSHFRPCAPRSPDGRLPCVIYCHTNSGSRRDVEEILCVRNYND